MGELKVSSFKDKNFTPKTGQFVDKEKPLEINTSDTVEISSPDEVQKVMSRGAGGITGYLTSYGKMLTGTVDGKQASWQVNTCGYYPQIKGTLNGQEPIDVQKDEFGTAEWQSAPGGLDLVFKGRWGNNDASLALGKPQGNFRTMLGRVGDRGVYITIAQVGSDMME